MKKQSVLQSSVSQISAIFTDNCCMQLGVSVSSQPFVYPNFCTPDISQCHKDIILVSQISAIHLLFLQIIVACMNRACNCVFLYFLSHLFIHISVLQIYLSAIKTSYSARTHVLVQNIDLFVMMMVYITRFNALFT